MNAVRRGSPAALSIPVRIELTEDPNSEKSQRAFAAMLRMKKLDIAELKRAYDG